ncbi:hypothetical protein OJF2_34320 [Aquisphaera giovannonii]|uniref:Uncharacterized protein n=1 Tax=Aquisphaera giovannonii TaxID=406548 RepID=A0A5B9W3R4_9BACT|nr:hypothetical protein [Aquisphaera giovannonii]QEH34887.1 hypothetical protein OJF2_34320 [Aquisphaera giovannonii]
MSDRLYTLRCGQGYFETGLDSGGQVLLGNTVREIVAHRFDMEGRFLGLERSRMDVDPPRLPGTTIYRTDGEYHRAVEAEMAAYKERIGFRPADIRVRAFESEEACIAELPGEYERYLESPDEVDPGEGEELVRAIAAWRAEGRFVLDWCVDYWISADGEVLAHG